MRRFELILLFAAMFAVAWPVVFGTRPRRGIAAGLLVAAFIVQLQVEGYRWQLLPLYTVAIGLAVGDVLFLDRKLRLSSRIARGVFGLTGVVLAASPALILPVPELPMPSGPETIGTLTVGLIDSEREEIYGPSPGGPREFVAQVWYPAEAEEGAEPLPWSENWDIIAPQTARRVGLPSWFLDHTRYTSSHAVNSLPVAEGTYPVIIYSHGWTGFRSIAVNQMEALASNGYIVIAPDHTYGAIATRLRGGDVVFFDPAALPKEEEVGEEAYLAAAEALIATFAGDIVTVLDALDAGTSGPFALIAKNADLTRIGVYGHSAGGGAAVQVCLEDERCQAVLGMDPWVEPLPDRVIRLAATRPAMYMRSDAWRGTENDAVLRGIAGRSEAVTYWIGVRGAGHNDFVVTPFISPLASQLGVRGPIPAGKIIPIINRYLVGFFDVFLLETGSAALDTVSFSEVTVEVTRP